MAWQVISLDFVTGLPLSGGFDRILVVVDSFTKYAHFLGLKHPTHLISDRDRVFTSQLWRDLFKLADVQSCMSTTTYHPQSDG